MKRYFFATVLLIANFLVACNQTEFKHNYSKDDHGITVQIDSLTLQIEVVDNTIVHVTKSLQGVAKSTLPEYVVTLSPQNVKWEVNSKAGKLEITTKEVKVIINNDGIVEYQDNNGNLLLTENKELTYIHPNAKDKCTVSQAFTVGDEALYGLGQFQSGIMNWKNIPVRLDQYNQEASAPFLVSTNGYGIYWNNYSLTDFNQPQFEIAFPDKEITANEEEGKESTDPDIENVVKHKVKKIKDKNIRETIFTPKKTGRYSFLVESDERERMRGEIRVTINADTIINYTTVWVPACFSGSKMLEAGKEYKVIFQNSNARIPGKLFYNEPDYNKTVFSSESGTAIDYYFIHGDTPSDILSKNHKLSGKSPLFQKKAYGFWQCRERYHNQEELLENARQLRERKIPADIIIQDWFYWPEGTKGPEWDRSKYPDPKVMASKVKDLNLLLMVSVWPQVINDPLLKKYDLQNSKFEKNHNLDFFDEKVGERYYRMLSDSMFQIGVNSIWLDGTEPAGKPQKDALTAVGPFKDVHNVYSLLVAKAMFEGKTKEYPNERVLNLTRSAFCGQQRYGTVTWSGDIAATWEQLAEQIPAGLNFIMAGLPYWTHDIGGFFRDSKSMNSTFDNQYTNPEYIELLARWFQFGTFSPIFRIHGYVSETEIWRYGQKFENMARKFIDLRYKLMPYIYSEAWKIYQRGHVLMSPLAYYYPNDKKTWEIKDQLFFGESLMVGLVTKYKQRNKNMYLPEGEWFNFWTNKKYDGGQEITISTPFDETPLFVKAGSILPIGPKIQYATQKTDKHINLKVYPGKNAEYVLYLDDNESLNYQKGEYSEIVLVYSEKNKEFSIKNGNGHYIDFKKTPMTFIVEKIGSEEKKEVTYSGNKIQFKL